MMASMTTTKKEASIKEFCKEKCNSHVLFLSVSVIYI